MALAARNTCGQPKIMDGTNMTWVHMKKGNNGQKDTFLLKVIRRNFSLNITHKIFRFALEIGRVA
jgi:hypothetical protein